MSSLKPRAAEAPASDLRFVREVFSSVADELEYARVLSLRVERAICTIAVNAKLDSGVVAELQQLDAIIQQIAAVRDYTSTLSRDALPTQRIAIGNALGRLTLSEVRARLAGGRDNEDDSAWEML